MFPTNMVATRRFLEPNSGTPGRLIRGLLIAPGAAYVAFGTNWPEALRIAAGVVMLLSLISAVTGHCFFYDILWWRRRRIQSH